MKVRSADGTNIWCDEWGGGPPLILVHGTGDDAGVFDRVRDGLAEHFHLYVMHRRGRGKSGDLAAYEFAREVEDILAVIYGVGAPAGLFGHSYGGILSLDAALETSNLAGMVIYEPPNIRVHDPRRTEIVERLQVYMEKGERDEVVRLFLHEFAGLPDEIVARQRQKKKPGRSASLRPIPSPATWSSSPPIIWRWTASGPSGRPPASWWVATPVPS